MRDNRKDTTIWRNYIEKYRFLIKEYEQVKSKKHAVYKLAKDFYKAHDTCGKSFLKYYNRYKQSGNSKDLEPQKRGPRYKTRRPVRFIENKVIELRQKGNSKLEIVNILKPSLHKFTPSPSGVYNICKRYGMIIIESFPWLVHQELVHIYGYVIMDNHIHVLWEQLKMNGKEMAKESFEKFTGHMFLKKLKRQKALEESITEQKDRNYLFWQRDPLAILITDKKMSGEKLDYMHYNPLQPH